MNDHIFSFLPTFARSGLFDRSDEILVDSFWLKHLMYGPMHWHQHLQAPLVERHRGLIHKLGEHLSVIQLFAHVILLELIELERMFFGDDWQQKIRTVINILLIHGPWLLIGILKRGAFPDKLIELKIL